MMLMADVNPLMNVTLNKVKLSCIHVQMGTSSVLKMVWQISWLVLNIMQIGQGTVICGIILCNTLTISRYYISWISLWDAQPILWWIYFYLSLFFHIFHLIMEDRNGWCRCAPVSYFMFYTSTFVSFITFSFKYYRLFLTVVVQENLFLGYSRLAISVSKSLLNPERW